jgi:hypothetical protein
MRYSPPSPSTFAGIPEVLDGDMGAASDKIQILDLVPAVLCRSGFTGRTALRTARVFQEDGSDGSGSIHAGRAVVMSLKK